MNQEQTTGIIPRDCETKKYPHSLRFAAIIRGAMIGFMASFVSRQTDAPLPVAFASATMMSARTIFNEYLRSKENINWLLWSSLCVESGLIIILMKSMPEELMLASNQAVHSLIDIYQKVGVPVIATKMMERIVEMREEYFMLLLYFLFTGKRWLALLRSNVVPTIADKK